MSVIPKNQLERLKANNRDTTSSKLIAFPKLTFKENYLSCNIASRNMLLKQFSDNLITFRKKRKDENVKIFDCGNKTVLKSSLTAFNLILKENEPTKKEWIFENNKFENLILHAWFARDRQYFNNLTKKYNRSEIKFDKDFYLVGEKGSGKSSTLHALNNLVEYFAGADSKKNRTFEFAEQNKISLYFKLHSHLNAFTFNLNEKGTGQNPVNLILDDLKFTDKTKSYGDDFTELLIQLLYARYDLWQFYSRHTLITSLLPPAVLKSNFDADLFDRFQKQYNILTFKINERTK